VSPDKVSPDKLAPAVVETVASKLLGTKPKQGALMTDGEVEPFMAWELYETKGENWLTSGWSLDLITTRNRGGLGIAKDIYKSDSMEVDLGAYVTQDYEELFQGNINPRLGIGMGMRF